LRAVVPATFTADCPSSVKLLTVAVPDALPALLDALRWFAALTGGWFGLPRFG
jgi:hypothetical protein